jgi:hypothetical protein
MHNGIQVSAMGYYGSGVLNMLIENRGVHEPQEERAFGEILKLMPVNAAMMELGSYWGFYSLWFAKSVVGAKCFLIEPNSANLLSGKINFRRAGCQAFFERAYVGREEGKAADGTPIVTVDSFCRRKGFATSLSCADIQAPRPTCSGGRPLLADQRSTTCSSRRTTTPSYECIELLKSHGYLILASADCDETTRRMVLSLQAGSLELPHELSISTKPKGAPRV